jgi:glycosyltransferase involved in cell wall biosynthesis
VQGPGVVAAQRPMPARPLHWVWRRLDMPPIEWFVGALDVVHGTNFVVPPTSKAAEVVTVHDLTPLRFPELCDAGSLAFPDMVRRALRRGAWVHTHSQFVADEIADAFGVDGARIRAVPPGVPTLPAEVPLARVTDAGAGRAGAPSGVAVGPGHAPPVGPPFSAGPPPMVGLPDGVGRYVLSIGTAEPRKDLPGLVRAFDAIAGERRDLGLVLVGPDGWGTAALDDAIGRAAFGDRIVRTGWVEDGVRASLLAGATVLAYPSVYEGFGLPPLEAMAAGVAVVATRGGAIPEALGDAARLVEVGDTEALAGALAEVLDSDPVREDLVRRGVERASTFTWSGCADGLRALYRVASTDRGGRRR